MPEREAVRLTINKLAADEACRLAEISPDSSPRMIAAAIEKLIFQYNTGNTSTTVPAPTVTPPVQPNKQALSQMIRGNS
ncbi:MAG: hypothetical protein FWK04_08600 [Nostoc sp. GBBB01]|nr:hypothetical protein [Nostoc sp. GBBB01]